MSDYISRETAIKLIKYYAKSVISAGRESLDPVDDIIVMSQMIATLTPSADVEPVRHVRRKVWGIDEYYGEWLQCPRCLYSENASNAKYCGGCGAKIDLAPPEGDSYG